MRHFFVWESGCVVNLFYKTTLKPKTIMWVCAERVRMGYVAHFKEIAGNIGACDILTAESCLKVVKRE